MRYLVNLFATKLTDGEFSGVGPRFALPLTDEFIDSYENSCKLNFTWMIYTLSRKKNNLISSNLKSKYIFFL